MNPNLKKFLNLIEKLDLEIKYKYENEEELLKIIHKIAKPKVNPIEKAKLGFIISEQEQAIKITKNKKPIRLYDNYITDITNLKNNIYKQYVSIKTKNDGIRKYIPGFINSSLEGFVASNNRYRAKKILNLYLQKYINDFK